MQPKPNNWGDGLPTAGADQCPSRNLPTAAQTPAPTAAAELARQLKAKALRGGEA